jgi:hypothetical protein
MTVTNLTKSATEEKRQGSFYSPKFLFLLPKFLFALIFFGSLFFWGAPRNTWTQAAGLSASFDWSMRPGDAMRP